MIDYIYKLVELSRYDIFVVIRFILDGRDFLEERKEWVIKNSTK